METTITRESQQPTLLTVFDNHLHQLHRRVGIDRARSTYTRQCQMRCRVSEFLSDSLHMTDIPLSQLTPAFIHDFACWLSTCHHYSGGTIWLTCQMLKSIVSRAYQHGLMHSNPFYNFRIGRNIRPRQFLTEQELQKVISWKTESGLLAFHRDLFVFSALTGMAFADVRRLRQQDISIIEGRHWIISQRHKTKTPFHVRLLPLALDIARRYAGNEETVFGTLCYRTIAKHIPIIVKACGITKHITFHCARHTFAVMGLNAGMPIESISRILGHADITTTQIYAKITLAKIDTDMNFLDAHTRRYMLSKPMIHNQTQ